MDITINEEIRGLYTAQCNLDIVTLRKTADEMYDIIKNSFVSDKSDYSGQSTLTTKLYSKYNFCMYPLPGINELYWTIHHVFHNCLTHFHGGSSNKRYFMQSWLNYYQKGEFIDWHCHTQGDVGGWHGFFCLDVEPGSYTSYRWPNEPERNNMVVDVQSENNLMVMGISNQDQHKSSEWPYEDRPRITIAFDIMPEQELYIGGGSRDGSPLSFKQKMKDSKYFVNHWIPI